MSLLKDKIQNILFQNDGKKRTINKNTLRVISIGFSLLGLLAVILGEPPIILKKKSEFQVTNVSSGVGVQTVSIPEHKVDVIRQPKSVTQSGSSKLPGPSLISRPGANEILPGTVAKARLQTAATDGPIKAILTEDVVVNGDVKIPSGSVLIGLGQSLDSRVAIQFSKAIIQENEVLKIGAVALDFEDQLVGLQASKLGGEAIHLGASIGLNFVGGMAEGLKDRTGINGATVDQSTMKNALLNGASRASLEEAKSMMEATKNKKMSLMVESGAPILVFFNGGN